VKLPLRTPVISATPSSPVAAPAPVAPQVLAAPAVGGGLGVGTGVGMGQPPSPEQIQAFRDEMRKRWGERQPGGGETGAPQFDRSSRGSREAPTATAVPTKSERPSKGSR
jgi:hypothetical protein